MSANAAPAPSISEQDVPLMIGGVNAAFLGVNDMQAHLDLYVSEFGWQVASTGTLTAAEAGRLWGEGVGELAYTELRVTGAGHGRLILLRVPDQEVPPHPLQADTGLVAINMYTKDIQLSHRELVAAGQVFRTPPSTWSVPLGEQQVQVTQAFVLAPEGVDIVLVEPATARGTAAWEADPGRTYTELTSVVCHVPDFDAEAAFWGAEGMGLQSWYDVAFSHPGLEGMADLPAGSRMRLSFLAGATTSRIEITRLENRGLGADHRAVQRTGRNLGHSGWLCVVADLDRTLERVVQRGGKVRTDAHIGPAALFEHRRMAFVDTPNGLPVTFLETTD